MKMTTAAAKENHQRAVLRERNSTDLFMKVALVKVKVKSSAAFQRIVANKNNITVSCGSWIERVDLCYMKKKYV